MELKLNGNTISFEDEENSFEIVKTSDDDIWFVPKKSYITQLIRYHSRNQVEWRSSEIFGSLLREIIGQSVLEKDTEYLPKDFINIENKIMIWHSDSARDNILEIQYSDKDIIVSIKKASEASEAENNRVIIRASGSKYSSYYQYFSKLYRELLQLALHFAPPKIETIQQVEEKPKILV